MKTRRPPGLIDLVIGFFDDFAADYDNWDRGLHGRLAKRLVEVALPAPGETGLDVGTGTGLVAHLVAEEVGAAGEVIGIDLSEGMLNAARAKPRPPAHIDFMSMAAEHLVFREGTFDLVTYGDTLSYLVDPIASLADANRILRSGGRIAVSAPRRSLHTPAQDLFFQILGPLTARHNLKIPRHTDDHGRFGEPNVLPQLLKQAGFVDLEFTEMVTGGRVQDARGWTELMAGAGPLPHTMLSVLGPQHRQQFEEELERRMRALGEDAYHYHHSYTFAVGQKPAVGRSFS